MTDHDVIERIAALVGRAVVTTRARSELYKTPYLVSMKGTPAVALMRSIAGEMGASRQAQIARVVSSWEDTTTADRRPARRSRAPTVAVPCPHECVDDCRTSWLAGLLEGEGAFTTTTNNSYSYPVIALQMCSEDVVRRAATVMSAKWVGRRDPSRAHSHWRTTFTTSVGGAAAADWMRRLRPLMGARRTAAIDAALAAYAPIRLIAPPDSCVVPGCHEPHRSRGLCHKHYMSWIRDVAKGREPRVTPLR